MRLYLCRHGIAEEAAAGMDDADRALTKEGTERFAQAARGFVSLRPRVTHIFYSPLKRARQTAEILRDVLKKHEKIAIKFQTSKALSPGGDLDGLLAELSQLPDKSIAIAVGHEPILGAWVGQLCFGTRGECDLKKGAIASLNLDPQKKRAQLLWLLQPKVLRQL